MTVPVSLHILAIDDDADTCANLRDILELDNYSVDTAGSAAQALARADWDKYAMIILDRRLPDGSAEELLPRLRERAPQAAIIVLTGYHDLEGAIAALRQGAVDYLLKPLNPDLLRSRLQKIAEHQRLTLAIQDAQDRALQSERLAIIGQMVAGMAHESRNALQRIQSSLEMLTLEIEGKSEALGYVDDIQKAVDHIRHLYEDLRRYAGPVVLNRSKAHLGDILQEAWIHLGPSRKTRDAQLIEHGDDLDLHACVDWFALSQVFRNILENALNACADPVRIAVQWAETQHRERPSVCVSVRDNGPGIPIDQRKRIFEPFFTTRTQGTGLGMAIAKRIVEAHGGTISVGSGIPPGAEIIVVLPREADEPELANRGRR